MDKRATAYAFLLSVISSVVGTLILRHWLWAALFSVVCLSAFGGVYFALSFRAVGFKSWSRERGTSRSFRACLDDAASQVDFLATWGGSIPSLSPHIEKTFQQMVAHGRRFRFLLLAPGSPGQRRREETRKGWPPGEPETTIRWLLNIKKSLGRDSEKFRVALYQEEPVWAMVLVDNRLAVVGYYGDGPGRENPGVVVESSSRRTTFFDAFSMQYNRLWGSAVEVESPDAFEEILNRTATNEQGFVLAITGPSGVGKTTLCRALVRRGIGAPSTTVTTREPRPYEVEGEQYEFVNEDRFRKLAESGRLLCQTEFVESMYGLRTEMIFDHVHSGERVILDTIVPPIQLKERLGRHVVVVFLMPTDPTILRHRMQKRGEVSGQEIECRLAEARRQMQLAWDCDYVLMVDDDLERSEGELLRIATTLVASHTEEGHLRPEALAAFRPSAVLHRSGRGAQREGMA